MTTRSIFQKICPACMITLPLDARGCACGHQFDHDDADTELSSEEIRLKAEELYENYLAARAEQAANAVMSAQAEYARDRGSAQKSNRVASAIQESEEARAALAAQSGRVAEMRKALPKPVPAPVKHPAPVAAAPVAPTKKAVVTKPAMRPAPIRTAVKAVKNTDTDDAITTSLVSRRAAKKKAATVTVKPRPAPAPVAAKPDPEIILPPVQAKTPNPAFRQAQAARAEKILRQNESTAAVKAVIEAETAATPKPEPRKPASLAPIMGKSAPRFLGADKKECPNCTASVDNRINRCRCGYEFPTSESLMPALTMSEEERAEFAKLFRFP